MFHHKLPDNIFFLSYEGTSLSLSESASASTTTRSSTSSEYNKVSNVSFSDSLFLKTQIILLNLSRELTIIWPKGFIYVNLPVAFRNLLKRLLANPKGLVGDDVGCPKKCNKKSSFQVSLKRNRDVQVVIDVHPVKTKKDTVDSGTILNDDTTRLRQVCELEFDNS